MFRLPRVRLSLFRRSLFNWPALPTSGSSTLSSCAPGAWGGAAPSRADSVAAS